MSLISAGSISLDSTFKLLLDNLGAKYTEKAPLVFSRTPFQTTMSESAVGLTSVDEKTPQAGPPAGSHKCVLCDNMLPTKQALQVKFENNIKDK
jgi:hypothetical protein